MITFMYILISLFSTIVFGTVAYLWIENRAENRRTRRQERKMERYLKSLYIWAYQEHIDRASFSNLVNGGNRRLEAELLSRMNLLTYGHINARIEKLIRWRHIDRMLIRRASETQGYKRAEYLKMLSMLPLNDRSIRHIRNFENDHNRYVRLFALLTQINHSPDRVIDIVATFGHPMGNLEFSQITLLLRRRFVPVSIYRELTGSYDRNLIMLGLYIIRLFRIEDATSMVSRLVPTTDKMLRNTVLHTLVTIRSPLTQRRVVTTVSLMGERGRKRFYRLIAGEGYSLSALHPFVSMEHTKRLDGYLCNAINGRKRQLNTLHNVTSPQ